MGVRPFSKEELIVMGQFPEGMTGAGTYDMFNYPISPKENMLRLLRKETPYWMPNSDMITFNPAIIPDNISRAEVLEAGECAQKGGPDMFGVEWIYSEIAGGSMVKPGTPMLEDVGEWREVINFPNIEEWDWQGCKERNADYLKYHDTIPIWMTHYTGLFERLISFMDFENAAVALVDEDSKEDVHALFSALCDLYEKIILNEKKYFDITGILFHDDWGTQVAPFFSMELFEEMIKPYILRLSDFCHKNEILFELHSCGKSDKNISVIADAGFDMWRPQPMNDTKLIYNEYGDKFILGLRHPKIPKGATEDEIRAIAKKMVEDYLILGKPVYTNSYFQNPVFRAALYEESRKAYALLDPEE